MIKVFKKHIPRFASGIKDEVKHLRKREKSFSEFRSACSEHFAAFWHDLMQPPLTEARKRAIRYLHVGIQLYNKKRFLDALHAFKRALDQDPKYSRAHLYYGNTQYKLRNPEEAIASWEFAIRVEPDSEAARKAQAKLDALRTKNKRAIHEIKEQLKKA